MILEINSNKNSPVRSQSSSSYLGSIFLEQRNSLDSQISLFKKDFEKYIDNNINRINSKKNIENVKSKLKASRPKEEVKKVRRTDSVLDEIIDKKMSSDAE